MSKFKGKKTNNAKTSIKHELREIAYNSVDDKSVLEVFCGAGEMYKKIWKNARFYTGIDKNKYFDERITICGDARKAIEIVDVSLFTIFDIDAYGSPYVELFRLAERIAEESDKKEIAFVVTDGSSMDLKMGRISKGIRDFLGIDRHEIKNAHTLHDDLIKMIVDEISKRLGKIKNPVKISTGLTGASMKYYTFTIIRDIA